MDIKEQIKQIIDDFTEDQAKTVLDFINKNFELVSTEEI